MRSYTDKNTGLRFSHYGGIYVEVRRSGERLPFDVIYIGLKRFNEELCKQWIKENSVNNWW